jgi:hypothetical protein
VFWNVEVEIETRSSGGAFYGLDDHKSSNDLQHAQSARLACT